jgi:hypothetical protein
VSSEFREISSAFFQFFQYFFRAESTMILQTGQEINELDQSGFYTDGPTVFCGNLGDNLCIIQVTPHCVRLLENSKSLQNLQLDLGSPIVHVSCADPYLVALTEDGQMILLSLDIGMYSLFHLSPQRPHQGLICNVVLRNSFLNH